MKRRLPGILLSLRTWVGTPAMFFVLILTSRNLLFEKPCLKHLLREILLSFITHLGWYFLGLSFFHCAPWLACFVFRLSKAVVNTHHLLHCSGAQYVTQPRHSLFRLGFWAELANKNNLPRLSLWEASQNRTALMIKVRH